MLDPRTLSDRRDEIAESCRRRAVPADLDGAIAAQERVTAAQTDLNETNRLRNEHQKAGKRKLSDEEREAHVAEGRRLKKDTAALEKRVAEAQVDLHERLLGLPNLVHPDAPVGGEEKFRELRRVGEPRSFDFEPLDHLELGRRLDLLDFESGTKVTGQKFYFLKNEAVLL